MLLRRTRATILQLKENGLGTRAIAKTLSLSRGAVKRVIAQGSEEPLPPSRPSSLQDHLPEILELTERCRGNLVRVHEELTASGQKVSYQALTAFVRSHSPTSKIPAGRYHFAPGKETLCGVPHRVSYAAPANMRRSIEAVALVTAPGAVML